MQEKKEHNLKIYSKNQILYHKHHAYFCNLPQVTSLLKFKYATFNTAFAFTFWLVCHSYQ